MVLAQICVECKEQFASELTNMVQMLFSINDMGNQKMIYGVLTALAVLCEEFAPAVEAQYA